MSYLEDDVRKKLTDYAKKNNLEEYRATLANALRVALTTDAKSPVSKRLFHKKPNRPTSLHFLSFHYNSRILRRWLRITADEKQAYESFSFSRTETQQWKNVYDWDSKVGHLLVDNRVKKCFAVVFGDSVKVDRRNVQWTLSSDEWREWFKFTRQHFLWFVSRGNSMENRYSPPLAKEWPTGPRLPRARIWDSIRKAFGRLDRTQDKPWSKRDAATRSFILTFFYSLGAYRADSKPNNDHLVIAMPILDDPHFDKYRRGPTIGPVKERSKLASIAMICFGPLNWSAEEFRLIQSRLESIANELARELAYFELQLLPTDLRFTTTDEDTIRQACEIDWQRVGKKGIDVENLETVDHYGQRWRSLLGDLYTPDLISACEFWKQLTASNKLVGASERYWSIIEDVKRAALSFVEKANKDANDRESQAIFFYSEPGCGKENLAALVHLITVLGIFRQLKTKKLYGSLSATDKAAIQAHIDTAVVFETKKLLKQFVEISGNTLRLKNETGATDPFLSYYPTSATNFADRQSFHKSFLGHYSGEIINTKKSKNLAESRLGPFLAAHFLRGTVFLDEFNTFSDPRWTDLFLRLFDKPYECEIPDRRPAALRNASVLMICASNRSREELIRNNFNSAVIYRLTKRYFAIPPLRERPVDIAVFTNLRVRLHNFALIGNSQQGAGIRRVHPDAMRLICELPWPDNYRGVQALLDDVLELRTRREIGDPVLSFEQVLEGVRRRELLLSQPSYDQPSYAKRNVA